MEPYLFHGIKWFNYDLLIKIIESGYILPRCMLEPGLVTDQNNINTFRQMLAKVQVKTIFAAIIDDGKIAACASAAIEHGYMLLHNVVVSPEKRGKGFGKQVCQSLIAKAKSEGTENAFLQVVRTNEVAYNLYKKLGFKKEYSYWYMRKK